MTSLYLSSDSWLKILSFLLPRDVIALGSTCHYLAKLIQNELLWEDILETKCSFFPSLSNAVEDRLFNDCKFILGDSKKTFLSLHRAKTILSHLIGTKSKYDYLDIVEDPQVQVSEKSAQGEKKKKKPFLTKLELLPVERSSIDYASQDIENTISSNKFWSATGCWDPNSVEYLIYKLPHPYTLILGLHVHSYSSNDFSGLLVSTGISENNFSFHSVLYPINSKVNIHVVVFPFLAIGKFMKITLTGPHNIDVGNSYMMGVREVSAWGVSLDMELLTPEKMERLTEMLRDNDPGLNDIVGRYAEHCNVNTLSNEVVTYVTNAMMSDTRIHRVIPRWNIYVGERDTTLSKENFDESEVPFLGGWSSPFTDLTVRKTSLILYPFWELSTKSEFLSSLKYLQILDLSSNTGLAGKILPEGLFSLVSLQVLNLIDAKLEFLPAGIGNLTNLVTLNLIGNQLRGIPPEIGKLQNLKRLFVGEGIKHHKREVQHTLGVIPPQLGDLVCLEHLWLANAGVTSIPPELGQLTRLTCLMLHNNDPGLVLPETLNNLKELKFFTFFIGGSRHDSYYQPPSPIPVRVK